jgi:hypothetical protein
MLIPIKCALAFQLRILNFVQYIIYETSISDATILLHELKMPGLDLFGYPRAYVSRNGV